MMKGQYRLVIYVALALALLGVFLAGGEAWARPMAKPLGQTVPTPTPVRTYAPTVVAPTISIPAGTPAPPAAATTLALTKTTGQAVIWPGLTATFTLTLTNAGSASLRQVTLEDMLPDGLEPGAVLSGTGASWNGRMLRASAPVLAPGGVLRVVYTARVQADIAPDAVLVNRAVATASDGQQAVAFVVLGQPPLELPRTGGVEVPEGGLR